MISIVVVIDPASSRQSYERLAAAVRGLLVIAVARADLIPPALRAEILSETVLLVSGHEDLVAFSQYLAAFQPRASWPTPAALAFEIRLS